MRPSGFVLAVAAVGMLTAPARGDDAAWATVTESPRAVEAPTAEETRLGAACGTLDARLVRVAHGLAERRAHGLPTLDHADLAVALRAQGEPHVWPRAWVSSGRSPNFAEIAAEIAAWRGAAPRARCGVVVVHGAGERADETVVAVVTVDAVADLAALPVRVHTGAWLDLDAAIHVPFAGARVVLLGPSGVPREVPCYRRGRRVRARFAPERPGAFAVQVVADLDEGPRPVLEARVFADVEPAPPVQERAPGEERAADGDVGAAGGVARMIASARDAFSVPPLARDARLDAVAAAHAARMAELDHAGHDVGAGDPRARLAEADLFPRHAGENVAHAATLALAHRALWASPSHRANILDPAFRVVGCGVARGADGSVWIAELFATPLPR
jgi:hypothetical protein